MISGPCLIITRIAKIITIVTQDENSFLYELSSVCVSVCYDQCSDFGGEKSRENAIKIRNYGLKKPQKGL